MLSVTVPLAAFAAASAAAATTMAAELQPAPVALPGLLARFAYAAALQSHSWLHTASRLRSTPAAVEPPGEVIRKLDGSSGYRLSPWYICAPAMGWHTPRYCGARWSSEHVWYAYWPPVHVT